MIGGRDEFSFPVFRRCARASPGDCGAGRRRRDGFNFQEKETQLTP